MFVSSFALFVANRSYYIYHIINIYIYILSGDIRIFSIALITIFLLFSLAWNICGSLIDCFISNDISKRNRRLRLGDSVIISLLKDKTGRSELRNWRKSGISTRSARTRFDSDSESWWESIVIKFETRSRAQASFTRLTINIDFQLSLTECTLRVTIR
jgi:hypothetical protein